MTEPYPDNQPTIAAKPGWKQVRVFISSTFRDMHAERDHLVKVCFPRLRVWCEERRLHLVDIDLRWGITREEAENGRAIEICLDEIEGCRPFFICLLGQQYGSVAPDASAVLAGVEPAQPYSITHLEILRAALAEVPGAAAVEPFFYLRDMDALPPTEALDAASPTERAAYAATFFQPPPAAGAPDLRQRLDALKQCILERFGPEGRVRYYGASWDTRLRNPATPHVPGQLAGLDGLGRMVEADLRRAISERFAAHLAALEQPQDPVHEEQDRQDAFIASRVQLHVADETLLAGIDTYVAGEGGPACCVWGPAGSGKSAALCWWVCSRIHPTDRSWRGQDASLLLFRAVGASSGSGGVPDLLAGLWAELLARLKGRPDAQALPDTPREPAELLRRWPELLASAAAVAGARIVLVIDGLDQLEDGLGSVIAGWVPLALPQQVRLVLSTAKDPRDAAGGWLAVLRRRGVHELPLQLLDEARSRAIVRALPSLYAKSLDERQTAGLLANPATRNPLFLTVALRELKLFGSFERLDSAVAALPAPAPDEPLDGPLHRLFGVLLQRLQDDQPPDTRPLVGSVLAWLAASRHGLAEQELADLLQREHAAVDSLARSATLQVTLRQLRPYLMRRQAADRVRIGFFHRALAEAVALRWLPDAVARAQRRSELAAFFGGQPWLLEDSAPNLAKVVELPWLQLQIVTDRPRAAESAALAALMLQWDLLDAKTRSGLVYELAAELRAAGRLLAATGGNAGLLPLVEEALRNNIGFIDAHRSDYPQALLQCLWNSCWWYDHPALAHHLAPGSDTPQLDGQLAAWAEGCRAAAALRMPAALWLRQLRPPFSRLGEGPRMRLTGFVRAVTALAWSPDGRYLLAVSADPALRVFDAASGEEVYRLPHVGREVRSIAVSPEGRRVALGLHGSVTQETIKEYSLLTGEHLATHKAHRSLVHRLRYSSDGRALVACSTDSSLSVWSVPDGGLLQRIGSAVKDKDACVGIGNFDLVPGTTWLLRCHDRKRDVQLWDWETGDSIGSWQSPADTVESLHCSPDGQLVAIYSPWKGNSGLWIHSVRDGGVVARLGADELYDGAVAWSPDSRCVAMACGERQRVRIWHVQDGACIADLRTHLSEINALAFSPDGSVLASASGSRLAHLGISHENEFEVHLVHPGASQRTTTLLDHAHEISTLLYTPDGAGLISTAQLPVMLHRSPDPALRIWDAAALHCIGSRRVEESIRTFRALPGSAHAISQGPCNMGNEQDATALRAWHWPTLRSAWVIRVRGWAQLRVLPDGSSYWLTHGTKAGLLGRIERSMSNGRVLREVPDKALAFSADGQLCATAFSYSGTQGVLRVLERRSLQRVAEFDSTEGQIQQACFSPAGDRLVHTDGFATVVREWPSGRELHRLRGHPTRVERLQVSDDGRWLTTAAHDRICTWDVVSGDCLRNQVGGAGFDTLAPQPFADCLWPLATQDGLRILQAPADRPVAFAPGAWHHLCGHPAGDRWVAARMGHLQSWQLGRLDAPWPSPPARLPLSAGDGPLLPVPPDPQENALGAIRRLWRRWFS